MRRLLYWLIGAAVVVAIAISGYGWQFGGPRVKREAEAYARAVDTCTPFEQDYYVPIGRTTLTRAVEGPDGSVCAIMMASVGAADAIRCRLDDAQRQVLSAWLRETAAATDFFASRVTISYSSTDPDPMTVLLNSDACTLG